MRDCSLGNIQWRWRIYLQDSSNRCAPVTKRSVRKIILINNQCFCSTQLILYYGEICSPFLPFQEFETNDFSPPPTTNLHGRFVFQQHLYRSLGFAKTRLTREIPSSTRLVVVFRKRNGVVTRPTRVRPPWRTSRATKYEEEIRGGMHVNDGSVTGATHRRLPLRL